MKKIIEKKHRLPYENYKGFVVSYFTLCIKNRINIFKDGHLIKDFIEILKESIVKHKCKNWIYVFMPDHLHFVLEGYSDDSNVLLATIFFKQKTGYYFKKYFPSIKWQKDFYDHILRKNEDLINLVSYIALNPVRKGLSKEWYEYPFLGSIDYNLKEIL